MGVISLLLSIILAAIVVGVAYWAVTALLPLPPPMKAAAQALMILVFLIWLLAIMGFGVEAPWRVRV